MEHTNHICGALEIKALSESDGTFKGYGSVFNVPDLGDDIVAPGCFTDSLKAWRAKNRLPKMLWQHKTDTPIGVYSSMSEDSTGLYVEGQLLIKQDVPKADEAYSLMKAGAVEGLSIGYVPKEVKLNVDTFQRTIIKADLYEVSPVTFPMNEAAGIDSIKSTGEGFRFESRKHFEHYLRNVCKLSKSEAKAVVSEAKTLFLRDVETEDSSQDILSRLNAETALIRLASF